MSVSFNKTGIILSNNFYESDGMNGVQIDGPTSYTPTAGQNSCINSAFKWYYPEGSVVGDEFKVYLTVKYSGFDNSNTNGTFKIRFQGTNATDVNTWAWQGANPINAALNAKQDLTNLVLSSEYGEYRYETQFTLNQTYMNSYVGSHLGVRSDFSNGTGTISLHDCKIVPIKYDINVEKMRIATSYIVTNDFIEY